MKKKPEMKKILDGYYWPIADGEPLQQAHKVKCDLGIGYIVGIDFCGIPYKDGQQPRFHVRLSNGHDDMVYRTADELERV